jgi:hypothetical protein
VPSIAQGTRGLVRWVCTNNPFYVVSALLVLLGLWVSFGAQARAAETWALMTGLASYTLLLALAACLLVRSMGVWDDVRTVLLLVVLMFLATSVTFDEVLARRTALGVSCYLIGLVLSVGVSEFLLHGIKLRLPGLFRVSYYLILALFFLYPVALVPLLSAPRSEVLEWALLAFPAAGGAVFLSLLPAIRRGRDYVRHNGSPWPWPLYPWTLFGLLVFGIMARSYLLCWSMQHLDFAERDLNIFGPYFLVPFLLALAVLFLEIGLAERSAGAVWTALLLPVLGVIATLVGHREDGIYQSFMRLVALRLGGTPFYLSLGLAAGFYAYAALRRVPLAVEAFSTALVALAFVGADSFDLDPASLTAPQRFPIAAVAILQLGLGLARQNSWRTLAGLVGLIVCGLLSRGGGSPLPYRGPFGFHLGLLALMTLGALFDDALGRWLRGLSAGLVVLAVAGLLSGRIESTGSFPPWVLGLYSPAMALVLAVYGQWLGHRLSLWAAALVIGLWVAAAGWAGYVALRRVVMGLDYIALGMTFFVLALATSAIKCGYRPWVLRDRSTVFETSD